MGIYKIECLAVGDSYIGQSTFIEGRWDWHKKAWDEARQTGNIRAEGSNLGLNALSTVFDNDHFQFCVIETCGKKEYLEALERSFIAEWQPTLNRMPVRNRTKPERMRLIYPPPMRRVHYYPFLDEDSRAYEDSLFGIPPFKCKSKNGEPILINQLVNWHNKANNSVIPIRFRYLTIDKTGNNVILVACDGDPYNRIYKLYEEEFVNNIVE